MPSSSKRQILRASGPLQRRAERLRDDVLGPSQLLEVLGGWRGVLRWLVDGFRESRANDVAASIAFYAMLSVVPITLGLVSIAGVMLRTDQAFREAVTAVLWIVPDGLAGDGVAALGRLRDQSVAYGLASIAGFLWIGSSFFAALGRAMNQVYGVPDRSPLQQRLRGFVSVLVFSVLFTAAITAAIVPTVVLGIDERSMPLGLERWRLFTGLYQLGSYIVAVLVSIVLFGVVFRVVPAAGQRVGDVVPGAVVIGLAFVVLAQAFPVYLRIVRDWNLIGGTAGLLSLVLVWFYILGHLFLFGAYINATWQRHRRGSDDAISRRSARS